MHVFAFRELRHMVIDIVLATDMARHFHQVNTLNYILHCMQQIERLAELTFIYFFHSDFFIWGWGGYRSLSLKKDSAMCCVRI